MQFVLYLSRRVKRWICSPASHQYLFCSSQASVFRFVQRSVYSPQVRLICLFKLRRTRELFAFCVCVNSSSSSFAISFRFCSYRCSVPPSYPPCSSVYTASLGPDYQPPSHQLSFPERPSQPRLLLVGSRGLVSIRHWMLSEFVFKVSLRFRRAVAAFSSPPREYVVFNTCGRSRSRSDTDLFLFSRPRRQRTHHALPLLQHSWLQLIS